MHTYHKEFAIAGIIIALIRYALYFRDIKRGTAKPHAFSWFVWGLLGGIAFIAQIVAGAGSGAWITGLVTVACLSISALAFFRKSTQIAKVDWATFVGALLGIVLWVITSNPLLAVIIVCITDALGYFPTYRKSFNDPYSEPINGYVLASMRSIFGILAIESFNLTTWLYPAALVVSDVCFVIMLFVRRRILERRRASVV